MTTTKSDEPDLMGAELSDREVRLADRCQFLLDDEKWRELQGILDRPSKDKPRLEALLRESGVLD